MSLAISPLQFYTLKITVSKSPSPIYSIVGISIQIWCSSSIHIISIRISSTILFCTDKAVSKSFNIYILATEFHIFKYIMSEHVTSKLSIIYLALFHFDEEEIMESFVSGAILYNFWYFAWQMIKTKLIKKIAPRLTCFVLLDTFVKTHFLQQIAIYNWSLTIQWLLVVKWWMIKRWT